MGAGLSMKTDSADKQSAAGEHCLSSFVITMSLTKNLLCCRLPVLDMPVVSLDIDFLGSAVRLILTCWGRVLARVFSEA